jgi:hypothetical protein
MRQNASESDDEDHTNKPEDIQKIDPYYINEDVLKQEEELLDETQKQVKISCLYLLCYGNYRPGN